MSANRGGEEEQGRKGGSKDVGKQYEGGLAAGVQPK